MAAEKKILIVIMDGLGDRACPELRGLTPLQYIRHPNLDWFLTHGQGGICDPIGPGIRAGSDTAHLSILGYDLSWLSAWTGSRSTGLSASSGRAPSTGRSCCSEGTA